MKTPCVHYEVINDCDIQGERFRFGICNKCGQVKWYSTTDWMAQPIIVKAGKLEAKRKKESVTMAKLKRKEKKELLKIGVDEFIKRHHYNPRAKSALSQSYDKLQVKETRKHAQLLPLIPQPLPPLLSAAISVLPVPTKELDEEVRKHIKDHFCNVIDVLYGKQVLVCHGQQSGQGG